MIADAPVRNQPLLRWAGLGGIVYVVLFIVGLILMLHGDPVGDDPPAKTIAYFQDSGHRDRIFVGWLLVLIGVFFLVWFVAALREVVRRLAGDGFLVAVTTIGGAIYAAMTLAAASVWTGTFTMSDDTYRHAVDPLVMHAASDVGYGLHSAGGAGLGAMMIAASTAALRARSIPAWLGWLGVVAGIVSIFSIFFFPWFVIAAWLVVAGALVTRSLSRAPVTPEPR